MSIGVLLLVPLVSQLGEGRGAKVGSEPLELRIKMSPASRVKGKVVLINRGDAEARVWRMGNSWGDTALRFVVTGNGNAKQIARKPQDYTRNVPSTVTLAHGAEYEIPFDLADGSWEPVAVVERLAGGDVSLEAVYLASKSPEAKTQHIWVGELRSQAVRLK